MGKYGRLPVYRDICIRGKSRLTDAFLAVFVSAAFADGWRKDGSITAESIIRTLYLDSDYACLNCLVGGCFGYEIPGQ